MPDKEYYDRCREIHRLLVKAHMDREILETLKMHKSNVASGKIGLGKNSYYVLAHICELVKTDLALSVWKIFYDEDRRANTIQHLNQCYNKACNGKRKKPKLKNDYGNLRDEIHAIRNQYLAHDQYNRQSVKLSMDKIYGALDEITEMYNELCNPEIDDRVEKFTTAGAIGLNTRLGFLPLIECGAVPRQNEVN